MKYVLTIVFLFMVLPVGADQENIRYVTHGKVVYEDPREEDVMLVKISLGRSTHLEFPEEPDLVEPGDGNILGTKILNLHNAVSIWPLVGEGQTNLTVYTRSRRYNFDVIIVGPQEYDRVIDLDDGSFGQENGQKDIPVNNLLKIGRNYNALKKAGAINKHNLLRKGIFKQFGNDDIRVDFIEAFTHKDPHYLILHVVVHNPQEEPINLDERKTNIYVKGEKLPLKYIVFDQRVLRSQEETDGWLILKNTYVSMDNTFSLGMGIGGKEYVLN